MSLSSFSLSFALSVCSFLFSAERLSIQQFKDLTVAVSVPMVVISISICMRSSEFSRSYSAMVFGLISLLTAAHILCFYCFQYISKAKKSIVFPMLTAFTRRHFNIPAVWKKIDGFPTFREMRCFMNRLFAFNGTID